MDADSWSRYGRQLIDTETRVVVSGLVAGGVSSRVVGLVEYYRDG